MLWKVVHDRLQKVSRAGSFAILGEKLTEVAR
jgi:hypothetical protein